MTFIIMGLCEDCFKFTKLELILSSLINVNINSSCNVEWLVNG